MNNLIFLYSIDRDSVSIEFTSGLPFTYDPMNEAEFIKNLRDYLADEYVLSDGSDTKMIKKTDTIEII